MWTPAILAVKIRTKIFHTIIPSSVDKGPTLSDKYLYSESASK